MEKIDERFFRREPVICAKELIGCVFSWKGCEGRIVETEAYLEHGDPACHTWTRPSARDFLDRNDAGTAYVYLNYGVHWLFNMVVKSGLGSGFVLFRALEPTKGLESMRLRRGDLANSDLCSGPGKLTKAFGIDGSDHGTAFLNASNAGLFYGNCDSIVSGPRIGISRATEREWRFGDQISKSLSKNF